MSKKRFCKRLTYSPGSDFSSSKQCIKITPKIIIVETRFTFPFFSTKFVIEALKTRDQWLRIVDFQTGVSILF